MATPAPRGKNSLVSDLARAKVILEVEAEVLELEKHGRSCPKPHPDLLTLSVSWCQPTNAPDTEGITFKMMSTSAR